MAPVELVVPTTKVAQIINISPRATKDQMLTLFGVIDDIPDERRALEIASQNIHCDKFTLLQPVTNHIDWPRTRKVREALMHIKELIRTLSEDQTRRSRTSSRRRSRSRSRGRSRSRSRGKRSRSRSRGRRSRERSRSRSRYHSRKGSRARATMKKSVDRRRSRANSPERPRGNSRITTDPNVEKVKSTPSKGNSASNTGSKTLEKGSSSESRSRSRSRSRGRRTRSRPRGGRSRSRSRGGKSRSRTRSNSQGKSTGKGKSGTWSTDNSMPSDGSKILKKGSSRKRCRNRSRSRGGRSRSRSNSQGPSRNHFRDTSVEKEMSVACPKNNSVSNDGSKALGKGSSIEKRCTRRSRSGGRRSRSRSRGGKSRSRTRSNSQRRPRDNSRSTKKPTVEKEKPVAISTEDPVSKNGSKSLEKGSSSEERGRSRSRSRGRKARSSSRCNNRGQSEDNPTRTLTKRTVEEGKPTSSTDNSVPKDGSNPLEKVSPSLKRCRCRGERYRSRSRGDKSRSRSRSNSKERSRDNSRITTNPTVEKVKQVGSGTDDTAPEQGPCSLKNMRYRSRSRGRRSRDPRARNVLCQRQVARLHQLPHDFSALDRAKPS